MSNLILPEYDNFLERVETGLSKKLDLTKIPEWICKNTRDPRNKRLRWSFADHEFQMGILSEAAAHVVVRKCSQVGLSEASVRLTLAVCYMRDLTGIYVLPTKAFVQKFSPDRIDRVVDNSPTLSTHKSKEHYNVGLKRIGDMSLYVVGSFSPGDAISVPAQFLVRDEYDFCKQSVLTTFDSRLGHNKEGEDFRRDFSTPTVAGYGIDKLFQEGDQRYYAVRHDACGKWVVTNFMDHVVVPGFSGTPRDLEKYHLADPLVRVEETYLCCPQCKKPISLANLVDPAKRSWVATYENRDIHSYQVAPYDVAAINHPARTIRQLKNYALKKDWVNFKVGDVHEDSESAFDPQAVFKYRNGEVLTWTLGVIMRTGCFLGVDVGAISWIIAGIKMNGKLRVVHAEQVLCRGGDDVLFLRVCELMDNIGPAFGVIDAGPDFNTADKLTRKYPTKFLACEYADKLSSPMVTLDVKEERRVVRAHRDKRFDLLVRDCNSGAIEWAPVKDASIISEHLKGMKKMRQLDEDSAASSIEDASESAMHWVKCGEDHYLHALNYCHMAAELKGSIGLSDQPGCLPLPGKVRIDDGSKQEDTRRLVDRVGMVLTPMGSTMRR